MSDTRTITGTEAGEARIADVPAPYLVTAIACRTPMLAPARYSMAETPEVLLCRGSRRGRERFSRAGVGTLRISIPDGWMSSKHARLVREEAGWFVEDLLSKNGTQLNGRDIKHARLVDGDVVEVGSTLLLFREEEPRLPTDAGDVDLAASAPSAWSTLSIPLARKLDELRRVASSSTPIVLIGASGTGKELTARAIHDVAGRRGAFVAVNCGAIPDSLVESELFGHRRGAFSGAAADKLGFVRAADGGTLFLDEIADLPLTSQAALLRVLQEREVVPVGDTKPVKVDLRIVSATHQNLAARAAAGAFRSDLFARLAGFTLELPALADRREDIGLVLSVLLRRIAGDAAADLRIDRSAARAFLAYGWPMNVRELEHALRTALAIADGDEIALDHLPGPVRAALTAPPQRSKPTAEEGHLVTLLERHAGNISAVARDLRSSRSHVHRLMKRHGLRIEDYRRSP